MVRAVRDGGTVPSSLATGNNWVVMKMNREEVMAMTNEELRIKAAELMGYEKVGHDQCFGDIVGYLPEADEGRGEGWMIVPDYPNNVAAGFSELIPRIIRATSHPNRDEAETIAVKHYSDNVPAFVGGPWVVNMIQEWYPSTFGGYAPIYTEIGGERPAQAITRAFIIAMKENHE